MADIPTTIRSKGALAQWAADTYGVTLDTSRTRRQMEADLEDALAVDEPEEEIADATWPTAAEVEIVAPEPPPDCGGGSHTAPRVHQGRYFCTTCGQLVTG